MNPLVSIVVPCYNKEAHISNMLASVYGQQWDNIELILINDGSTDGTRDVILQWIPRIESKGYIVRLIDQDNHGLPYSVWRGLCVATGDYVCSIDSDDEITSDYLKIMGGYLRDNPDCEWVICDLGMYSSQKENKPPATRYSYQIDPKTISLVEDFVFWNICTHIGVNLVRRSYMIKCGILETFDKTRGTQEPQFFLPLAINGGRKQYIPHALYKYNTYAAEDSVSDDFLKRQNLIKRNFANMTNTINNNVSDSKYKAYLNTLNDITLCKILYNSYLLFPEHSSHLLRFANETAELVNKFFVPELNFTGEDIISGGFPAYFTAIENFILKRNAEINVYNKGKIIGYGALSAVSQYLLKPLFGTDINPEILWDKSATGDEIFCSVDITPMPDDYIPNDSDTVIILIRKPNIANEVDVMLRQRGFKNILNYFEICDYLAHYYFVPRLKGREFKYKIDSIK